jgi:hypothetical protein
MFQIGFLSYQILDKSFYEEIVERHFVSQKPLNVFSFYARLTSFDDDVGSGIEKVKYVNMKIDKILRNSIKKSYLKSF